MKHNSRNKKRGAGSETRSSKKRKNMKSPLMITLAVLVLFVVLILFSVFNGPIEKKENQEVNNNPTVENLKVKEATDPTVNFNLAVSSDDISKCNGDKECEDWFYFANARKPEDCDMIKNEELKANCKKENA